MGETDYTERQTKRGACDMDKDTSGGVATQLLFGTLLPSNSVPIDLRPRGRDRTPVLPTQSFQER